MSKKTSETGSELLAAIGGEFRQLATATVLFHQAIADRLGMHATDHRCLEILSRAGRMTAGELTELTGLTTGATTGVIDRLEKAGFVRRVEDPDDRRRVVIEPFPERIEREIAPLFRSLAPAMAELCGGYSAHDLAVIREFIASVQVVVFEQIRKLRETDGDSKPAKGSRPNVST